MLRDLIKEGGLYTVANLLTKGISLLLIPFYTAYFSPADYGVIGLLSVFGVIFTVVFSLQLNQSLARYVGDEKIAEDLRIKYASSAINFVLIVYTSLTALALFFPEPIIDLLSEEQKIPVKTYQLAIISISVNGVFYLLGVYMRFMRMTFAFSLSFIFHAVLNIGLTFYLIIGQDYGIDGIYIASIGVTPLIILYQLYILRGKVAFFIGKKELKQLIGFGIFLIPAGLSQVLLNFADRIFIVKMDSFDQAGLYDVAGKFSSMVALVVTGFSMAITPIIYNKYQNSETKNQLARIFHLYLGIGGGFVFILSAFSFETVFLLTDEAYINAHIVMPVLYLSAFISGIYMFAPGLLITKKTGLIGLIVMFALCVNIVLNLYLIPKYGNIGAAIATLVGTIVNVSILFYYSQKFYSYKVRVPTVLIFGLAFTALTIAYYLDPFEKLSIESIAFKLGLSVVFAAIIFLIRLVGLKKMKELLSFRSNK